MRYAARKEDAFSRSYRKYLAFCVEPHLPGKEVHEFVLARVDMGRRFGARPHLGDHEVKGSLSVRRPRHVAHQNSLVPGRIAEFRRSFVGLQGPRLLSL